MALWGRNCNQVQQMSVSGPWARFALRRNRRALGDQLATLVRRAALADAVREFRAELRRCGELVHSFFCLHVSQ